MSESVVYFLCAGIDGPIKIGRTRNLSKRVRSIQTGSPEKIDIFLCVPGGVELEQHLHKTLSDHRMSGEWFHPHPEVLAIIDKLKVNPNAFSENVDATQPAAFFSDRTLMEVIASALEASVAGERNAIGTIAATIGANKRTVEGWLARDSVPSAAMLVRLMRSYDLVFEAVIALTGRKDALALAANASKLRTASNLISQVLRDSPVLVCEAAKKLTSKD